jgi:putative DNA primase/helicase
MYTNLILSQLKPYPNWVCGREDKTPVDPKTGQNVKVNDPGTCGTFEQARDYLLANNSNGIKTIGFMVENSPFTGLDFDRCRDPETGQIEPRVTTILEIFGTYAEISPSGTGIRAFVEADVGFPKINRKKGGLGKDGDGAFEIANKGKYFSVTGNRLKGMPDLIQRRPEDLREVYDRYFPEKTTPAPEKGKAATLSDEDLLQRARNASNGKRFSELYAGNWNGYESQSEADLALCSILVFWVGNDVKRVDKLFRQSGLYREKWDDIRGDGSTYGKETIRKAMAEKAEVYKQESLVQVSEFLPTDILSQLLRWNDIQNLTVSTKWLLDKLIPKEAITFLFSTVGGGKTWLMMQIAAAIANGVPFGDVKTLQTPVYYVDFENPLSVVNERMEKIGPADELYCWHLSNKTQPPRLDSPEWTLYKKLPPGLLIFDSLRSSQDGDENGSKDIAAVMSKLKQLRELGFTIVVLHHATKGKDGIYKGSTAIFDLSDHILYIERKSKAKEDEFDLDAIYKFGCKGKTRFEPNEIFFTFDPARGFIPRQNPDINTMKVMADILEDEGPLNQKAFRSILEDKLKMQKKLIFKLLKKGDGTYWITTRGRNNSIMYSCVPYSVPGFPPNKGGGNQEH